MAELGKRRVRLNALDEIRQEYRAMRFAAAYARDAGLRDPTILPREADYRLRDLDAAADSLEGTYVIRLFAEFEAGLRSYWSTVRATSPPVGGIMDAIASRSAAKISAFTLLESHEVRAFRNSLVHEEGGTAAAIPLEESHRRLKVYLSRLPWDW